MPMSDAPTALATPQSTETFAMAPAASAVPSCNYSSLTFVSGTGYELQCSQVINPGLGTGLGIAGGAILGSGLVSFVTFGILGYDGSKADHVLRKSDACLLYTSPGPARRSRSSRSSLSTSTRRGGT